MEPNFSSLSLLNLKGHDAEVVWTLAHSLDLQIQSFQQQGACAQHLLEQLGPWILDQIGASGLGVQLQGYRPEGDSSDTFYVGSHQTWLQQAMREGMACTQTQGQSSLDSASTFQGQQAAEVAPANNCLDITDRRR